MTELLTPSSYPESLEMVPLDTAPRVTLRVPGSKSITNRALVLAALTSEAAEPCELQGVLFSEDTWMMIQALEALGFSIETRPRECRARVGADHAGRMQRIPYRQADLFVGNSGTSMRFLTAVVSLGHGRYRLDGIERMRERPIEDLLSALRQLGVRAYSERGNGCPPVVVEAEGIRGGRVTIHGDVSSQFLSGLLMVAPFAGGATEIEVDGPLVSRPYILMTLALMREFGLEVQTPSERQFRIGGNQQGGLRSFAVGPDASAASYFFGAAAITQGEVTVPGLNADCLQGDVRFVDALEQMGCEVTRETANLTVRGGPLRGIDIDMNDISDTVMTLAAVACFAEGPTTIRNVGHIRHKETDRLHALATELRRVGAGVEVFGDGLKILPQPLHGATIETYHDHRMAMSLALIGLRVPGVVIRNPGCVAKTYPEFFIDLDRLRHGSDGRTVRSSR